MSMKSSKELLTIPTKETQPGTSLEKRLLREIWRTDAKQNLEFFMEYDGLGNWKTSPHLSILCNKLQSVAEGNLKRLIVCMPPRHGKSEVGSKKFPAWYIGNYPNNSIILSSYSADLAYDFSRIARNTLQEHSDLFGIKLAKDSSAIKKWNVEDHKGGLIAAGVDGPITGRGGDIIIIDDPVKSWKEAQSKTIRDTTYEWYQSVAQTRLAPGGAIVLIMTRWHHDDLAGKLLRAGEDWEVINFPAIAKEGFSDALNRDPGEALWPDRYDKKALMLYKNGMLNKMFESIYQQNPTRSTEETMWNYDMLSYVRLEDIPQLKRIVVAIDPATTFKISSDETGIIVAGLGIDNKGYVLEDGTMKGSPNSWARKAIGLYKKWEADLIVGEVNQGGDMVENVIRGIDRNISYKGVRATRGKQLRAEPIAALYEADPTKVFHTKEFDKLENQMIGWEPGDDSPDRLDALVWGLTELMLGEEGVQPRMREF